MNCEPARNQFQVENENCWLDVLLNHGNPTHQQKTAAFDFVCQNIMQVSDECIISISTLNISKLINIFSDCQKRSYFATGHRIIQESSEIRQSRRHI